jgi:hypothetical protein
MTTHPTCPHCGTPLPFQTLKGTAIRVTGDCPRDSCPNPERFARESRETLSLYARVLGALLLTGLGVAVYYLFVMKLEQTMVQDCGDRGGEWAPVRGVLGLPTGTGTCTEHRR